MSHLDKLETNLKYRFKDRTLLREALTHSSYKNENKKYDGNDNERLEFFGDSILGFIIAEHLFRHLKGLPEGTLTKFRAKIVCEETLSETALEMSLGEYIRFGKGELLTGGKERPSILADAFESLIAAIYLDSDVDTARKFVLGSLKEKIDLAISGHLILDHKTAFQELVQRGGSAEIVYHVVDEFGPDHNKTFVIAVKVDGKHYGQGTGRNKKEAEQNAAQNAMEMGMKN
jgi:ribonuclease-3